MKKLVIYVSIFLLLVAVAYAGVVSHTASQIVPGDFAAGDYTFDGNLNVTAGNDFCIEGSSCLSEAGSGTVGGTGAANRVAFWTAASTIGYDNDNLVWDNSTNRLGLGTTSPNQVLAVVGNANITGNMRSGTATVVTTSATNAVYGQSTAGDGRGGFFSGIANGVVGQATSTSGVGVYGVATQGSGTTYGVYSNVSSSSGYAGYFKGGRNYFEGNVGIADDSPTEGTLTVGGTVYATNSNLVPAFGVIYGVNPATSSCTNTMGVQGQVSCATGYGVYGVASGSSARGVYGSATAASGTNYGVYGQTASSSGYAGYFTGGYGLRINAANFERSSVGNLFACTSDNSPAGEYGNNCSGVCSYRGLSCINTVDVATSGDRSGWAGSGGCSSTCGDGGGSGGILFCLCS
ncbi:hypothetical protein GF371_04930 [Candidatus Woesearchaeota archaeon]|nr:hypothetical protein [Candidatus Woesearchaeota archaeon]